MVGLFLFCLVLRVFCVLLDLPAWNHRLSPDRAFGATFSISLWCGVPQGAALTPPVLTEQKPRRTIGVPQSWKRGRDNGPIGSCFARQCLCPEDRGCLVEVWTADTATSTVSL